jgi:hypothetical protein
MPPSKSSIKEPLVEDSSGYALHDLKVIFNPCSGPTKTRARGLPRSPTREYEKCSQEIIASGCGLSKWMIVYHHSTETLSSWPHRDNKRRAITREGEKPMPVLVPRNVRSTILIGENSIMSLSKNDLLER